ncbi:MAG: aminotransferase class I/II-fold pyridoxal phosphate-dependent enzyme [Ruminococcus sp.]|nr:aminotransferase class I/II-fold pyridoxal phosphate-dependent enzyme [Ruminococcus sp.]
MIHFNIPPVMGDEEAYIKEVIKAHKICGDGKYTKLCSTWLENQTGTVRALLTTSCTHATEMTALLAGIQPGDEVIMPSYTFVSTADVFVLRGAVVVFVDIRPDTMNLDETLIEDAITPRTKAIVPVHYAGVSCEMDKIMYGMYQLLPGPNWFIIVQELIVILSFLLFQYMLIQKMKEFLPYGWCYLFTSAFLVALEPSYLCRLEFTQTAILGSMIGMCWRSFPVLYRTQSVRLCGAPQMWDARIGVSGSLIGDLFWEWFWRSCLRCTDGALLNCVCLLSDYICCIFYGTERRKFLQKKYLQGL